MDFSEYKEREELEKIRLAKLGDIPAQVTLFFWYWYGYDDYRISVDRPKALYWKNKIEVSARHGDRVAMGIVGRCHKKYIEIGEYDTSIPLMFDENFSEQCYHQIIAEAKDENPQSLLGAYQLLGDNEESFGFLCRSAELGNGEACFELAQLYSFMRLSDSDSIGIWKREKYGVSHCVDLDSEILKWSTKGSRIMSIKQDGCFYMLACEYYQIAEKNPNPTPSAFEESLYCMELSASLGNLEAEVALEHWYGYQL